MQTLQAWLLTMLLLSGGPALPKVCSGCPQTGVQTSLQDESPDRCCSVQSDESPDETRSERPGQPEEGCDCPFGCCAPTFVKAIPGPVGTCPEPIAHADWDLPADHALPEPVSDGPRRPPRA